MKLFLFLIVSIACTSCFLLKDYKKDRFTFRQNGTETTYRVLIPRGIKSKEQKIDSLGNAVQFYYYKDGAVLYFADVKDSSVQYQQINYEDQVPKPRYNTIFFKGIDGHYGHYWRESRTGNYKAGYYKVDTDEDGKFDSAINYFTLRSVKPVQ